MSLRYQLFRKVITLDDFITEAKKRGLHDLEIAPLCYDSDIFKYDPNAEGKRGILHRSMTSINVWTTQLGSDGYAQLYIHAKEFRYGEEYDDGHKEPLHFNSLEEWDAYTAKINEKEVERGCREREETLKMRERLLNCGFNVRDRSI